MPDAILPSRPLAESLPSERKALLADRLGRDGYLYFRRFFSAATIKNAHLVALELCHQLGFLTADYREDARILPRLVGRPLGHSAAMRLREFGPRFSGTRILSRIASDSRLLRLLGSILGGRVVLHPRRMARHARCHLPEQMKRAMRIHQDFHFVQIPEQTYSVWVPMMVCPRHLGGLALLEGSHLLGELRHRDHRAVLPASFRQRWRTTDYEPGDALIFHSHVVHGPLPNRTVDCVRLAFDFRYCRRDLFTERFLRDRDFGRMR